MLKTFGYRKTSYLEFYAQVLSRICSGINRCSYDLVIVRDYFFGAYLTVDVSTVYIGDTTFRLFKANLNMPSAKFEEIADEVEKRMIQNADSIIFSSNWAKESALKDYSYKKIISMSSSSAPTFHIPKRGSTKLTQAYAIGFLSDAIG
jgi:hypothetical protein